MAGMVPTVSVPLPRTVLFTRLSSTPLSSGRNPVVLLVTTELDTRATLLVPVDTTPTAFPLAVQPSIFNSPPFWAWKPVPALSDAVVPRAVIRPPEDAVTPRELLREATQSVTATKASVVAKIPKALPEATLALMEPRARSR